VDRILAWSGRPVGDIGGPVAVVLAVDLGLGRSLDREAWKFANEKKNNDKFAGDEDVLRLVRIDICYAICMGDEVNHVILISY
jgi:hypothetical protein